MTTKMWVVLPLYREDLFKKENPGLGFYKHVLRENLQNNFGIFFSDAEANHFAQHQTAINGGIEMVVCENTTHYYAKPAQIRRKVWKGGELIAE